MAVDWAAGYVCVCHRTVGTNRQLSEYYISNEVEADRKEADARV